MKKWTVVLVSSIISLVSAAGELHPYEKELENEVQWIEVIRQGILGLQAKNAQDGKKLRGTHAKGICSTAKLKVDNTALKNSEFGLEGLYQYPGEYPVTVRFSNAKGTIESDWEPDVRSLSVKVELPEKLAEKTGVDVQDYSTNNNEVFPIKDVKEFANLFTQESKLTLLKTILRGREQNRKWLKNKERYTKVTYHSSVPFAYGDGYATKYVFSPCKDEKRQPQLDKKDPDALSNDFVRQISEGGSFCFDMSLVFLDDSKRSEKARQKTPVHELVEDGTKSWKKESTSEIKVGQLVFSGESLLEKESCEELRFNVNGNTFEAQRGIGNINRGRSPAEKASGTER